MTTPQEWIAAFHHRMVFGRWLKLTADWMAIFFLTFGALVLLSKLVLHSLWPHIAWGLLAVPVLLLVAWRRASRSAAAPETSVALLDRELGAGGLLMTLTESATETDEQRETLRAWGKTLPRDPDHWAESMPKIRPARFLKYLFVPVFFVCAAGLVPVRQPMTKPTLNRTVAQKAIAELQEKRERLAEKNVLTDEESDSIREEIEKLVSQTKTQPLTHEQWEVVDALEDRMSLRLEATRAKLSKAFSAQRALADDLNRAKSGLTVAQNEQLTDSVLEALGTLNAEGEETRELVEMLQEQFLSEGGSKQPRRVPQTLTREQRERRGEALARLENYLQGEIASIEGLRDTLQLDLDGDDLRLQMLRKYAGVDHLLPNGERSRRMVITDADGNERIVMVGPDGQPVATGSGSGQESLAGSSSVLDPPEDPNRVRFRETVLPPGFLDRPEENSVGARPTPPKDTTKPKTPEQAGPIVRNDPTRVDQAEGGITRRRVIRPSRRAIVKKFLTPEEESSGM